MRFWRIRRTTAIATTAAITTPATRIARVPVSVVGLLFCWTPTWIDTVVECPVFPPASWTVSTTLNDPVWAKVWVGFCWVELEPSPKFHDQLYGAVPPEADPAKDTVKGAFEELVLPPFATPAETVIWQLV